MVKYYSEDDAKTMRLAFERKILRWPKVSSKKMFGCPCYKVEDKLFAFLVTDGIVITRLDQADRERLSRKHPTTSFRAGKRRVKNWIKVAIENQTDIDQIMPFLRKSYESALQKE